MNDTDPSMKPSQHNFQPAPLGAQEFRAALAMLPGGVNVITTAGDAGLAGFTASAVCSVTDQPPTVLVCMNRSARAYPAFSINRVLCVNVLSGAQRQLSATFADPAQDMSQRFAQCSWQPLATGAPALAGALASLDGDIVEAYEVGTHSVFIVRLRAARIVDADAHDGGLAYFKRAYHVLAATPLAPTVTGLPA